MFKFLAHKSKSAFKQYSIFFIYYFLLWLVALVCQSDGLSKWVVLGQNNLDQIIFQSDMSSLLSFSNSLLMWFVSLYCVTIAFCYCCWLFIL